MRIKLSKFFRATGLVLDLVAAGLVVSALRTAHGAGWLDIGQGGTVDLTWLVAPGSVQASMLTGMLGVQGRPVVVEVIGWLVYLVPVGLYVAWPPGRSLARRGVSRLLLACGAALALAAAVLTLVAPGRPNSPPTTGAGVVSVSNGGAVVRTGARDVAVTLTGAESRAGVLTDVYTAQRAGATAATLPTEVSLARVAELNAGRPPIGLQARSGDATLRYADSVVVTAWIEPRTRRLVDLTSRETITASIVDRIRGALALGRPVATITSGLPYSTVRAAASAASGDLATVDRRTLLLGLAWAGGGIGVLVLLAGAALSTRPRRRAELAQDRTWVSNLVGS